MYFRDSEIILGDSSTRRYRILPRGMLVNLACILLFKVNERFVTTTYSPRKTFEVCLDTLEYQSKFSQSIAEFVHLRLMNLTDSF